MHCFYFENLPNIQWENLENYDHMGVKTPRLIGVRHLHDDVSSGQRKTIFNSYVGDPEQLEIN